MSGCSGFVANRRAFILWQVCRTLAGQAAGEAQAWPLQMPPPGPSALCLSQQKDTYYVGPGEVRRCGQRDHAEAWRRLGIAIFILKNEEMPNQISKIVVYFKCGMFIFNKWMLCTHTHKYNCHSQANYRVYKRKDLRSWQAPGSVAQKWDTNLKLMTNGSSQMCVLLGEMEREPLGPSGGVWSTHTFSLAPHGEAPQLDGLPAAEGRPSMAAGQQLGDRAVGLRPGSDPGAAQALSLRAEAQAHRLLRRGGGPAGRRGLLPAQRLPAILVCCRPLCALARQCWSRKQAL